MSINGASKTDIESNVLLTTENLTKTFGSVQAVSEVDFTVARGEVHAIIGPNGAGKTTFFDLLTGAYSPTSGSIIYESTNITDSSMDKRARRGIVRVFQITQIFDDLSIKENLYLALQSQHQSLNLLKKPEKELFDEVIEMIERLRINAPSNTAAENLSHGDKKKLEIGMALITEPKLLLLDEPTSGMSQEDSQETMNFINKNTHEIAVLLIEHDVEIVLEMADIITVLQEGSIIAEGLPGEIENDERVRQAYLGDFT